MTTSSITTPTAAGRLVALYAPAEQSGKSEVAARLESRGFQTVKFADPLKDMLRVLLFDHLGYDHETTERYLEGDLKEAIVPELGVTCRHLMRTLGTEWMRKLVCEDGWVRIGRKSVARRQVAGVDVVVDDMRFVNEMDALLDLGGECIRIERPGRERTTDHASEGGLDDIPMTVLKNDGTLDDLTLATDRLLGYA